MTDPIIVAVRFIAANLEWLRHQPDAADHLADLQACARAVRGIARGRAERKYLGPCGAPLVDFGSADCANFTADTCDGDIYAIRGASVGRCRSCSAEVATAEREAWLDGEVRGRAFSLRDIADAHGLNVKTLRSWATERPEARDRHGKVTRSASPAKLREHSRDLAGNSLFLVGDVLDLAAADAARRAEQQAKRARLRDQADTQDAA